MKVWLAELQFADYEPLVTIGVFSTEDKAKDAVYVVTHRPSYNPGEGVISEWDVDEIEGQ